MRTPCVAAIHDMSGFGRCSLTVIMPALSAMGVQCCPIPTAYLSTHTGGFEGFHLTGLDATLEPTARHWRSLGIRFDAIYSGFLADIGQIEQVRAVIEMLCGPGTLVLVDPVMGDDGKRYTTYTDEMCRAMGTLAREADLITPNLTEAALLLGEPYSAVPRDEAGLFSWLERLSEGGTRSVVMTGVRPEPGRVGAAYFDAKTGTHGITTGERVAQDYPGTGDLFASVLLGGLLGGKSLDRASETAAGFVRRCAAFTLERKSPVREGVQLEPLLHLLHK